MFLAQTVRKKIFCFNFLIEFFINLYLDTYFLYYNGILAFIFEHLMGQEILCNKELQNTRTDTRYFRYYPCLMCIFTFPSKIWAKKVHIIHGEIRYVVMPCFAVNDMQCKF